MQPTTFPEIAGFRCLRELGRGGSATVYLAEKEGGGRYALKVFHGAQANQADTRRRILGEWKAAATEEKGFVRIHDFLETNGHSVLVMDFIEGDSLAEFQARLPYVLPEISVLVAIEILRALEGVHGRGIVHRDLKPSNVLIDKTGRTLLTDFGLAKWSDASTHTMHGVILGSPDFMSPEQAHGDVVTPQSDLFSLASILYFLVTGTRAFSRSSPLATLAALIKGEFEPAGRRNPKISPELSRLLQKGLSAQPRARFTSAQEFRECLENYLREVGFPAHFTLAAWIARPSESTMEALQSIAEHLAARGRRALDRGDRDQATEILAHLSLVAPDSLALQELLDRLERRRKTGFLYFTAAGLALLCLTAGFFAIRPAISPEIPATAGAEAPKLPATESTTVESPLPVRESPAAPTPPTSESILAENPPRPKPSKSSTKQNLLRPQLIRFQLPAGVEADWDGIAVPLDRPFRTKPGVYELTLRKEGFNPLRRRIEVKAGEPTVIQVN